MTHRIRISLLALSALLLGGCEALLDLGEEPDGESPPGSSASGVTSTGDTTGASTGAPASGTSTGAGGAPTTTSTGAGGEGAGSSSTGSGGAGGGSPVGGCGTPTAPGCVMDDGVECLRSRNVIPGTTEGALDRDSFYNRFSRGLVANDRYAAFTRQLEGGPVLDIVSRGGNVSTGLLELTVIGDAHFAIAANPLGSVLVLTGADNGVDRSVYRVALPTGNEGPALQSVGTLDEKVGSLVWQSGATFVGPGRNTSRLLAIDATGASEPCVLANPDRFVPPAGITRTSLLPGANLVVVHFAAQGDLGFFEVLASTGCDRSATPIVQGIASLNRGYGVAAAPDEIVVAGVVANGDFPVALNPGTGNTVATYPGGGIAMSPTNAYIAHPGGGLRKCTKQLVEQDITACDPVFTEEEAGRVTRVTVSQRSVTSLGFIPTGNGSGDAILMCGAL